MKVQGSIKVDVQHTADPKIAQKWLDELPDLIACDFETAIRYTDEKVEAAKAIASSDEYPKLERIEAQAIANATALGHPSHCTITHCSIACKKDEAYVFIIDSQEMADVVLDFLVSTERVQVWHNYGYDGRFLRYYAGADPKHVEDSQILAKTLLNHVEVAKAASGLKQLMGGYYGDWGVSEDVFVLSQQYDLGLIQYAGIDAAATYHLWEVLQAFIAENSN